MVIPLKDSTDPSAKTALARREEIKSLLNLTYSSMAQDAPKDMAAERAAADFDIDALARHWAGGDVKYELLQRGYQIIKADPELVVQPPRNFLELSRNEMREFTMGQIYNAASMIINNKYDPEMALEVVRAICMYNESFAMRYFVHSSLFRNVIMMLGNKEQQDEWIDQISSFSILGCFAMTELGHSSALRDMETTATYDPAADEFVLDSPSITATKWWIGLAAQTATHAVMIAQTVIRGKNVGLNWFVVQLRDKVNGTPVPGVVVGDIGEKVGHAGVDNGWIQFRGKRIPRTHMLSKWSSLDRDGNYTPASDPAVMYATLIPERLTLVEVTTQLISQALVIATRYGVVRRQGPQNQQIMDYQSHYAKIVPAIAFLYMLNSVSGTLDDQFSILTAGGNMDPATYLDHMGDMHAMSSCLKGFTGWYSSEILEMCRRACGGHAYSSYNALGHIIGDWGVMTTGGGDNVVILQQATRLLLSRLKNKLERDTFPTLLFKSSTDYILHAKEYLAIKSWSVTCVADSVNDLHLMEEALHVILVKRLFRMLQGLKSGLTENDMLLESVRVSQLHCAAFMFSSNVSKFGPRADTSGIAPSVVSIMRRLTTMWGLHCLHVFGDQGFKEGFLSPEQIVAIEECYLSYSKSLRKQVIGLTDAWAIPDFVLKAPIAKCDGDIYQAYFETLLQAPNSTGVPSYHERYIKPLTERELRSKL